MKRRKKLNLVHFVVPLSLFIILFGTVACQRTNKPTPDTIHNNATQSLGTSSTEDDINTWLMPLLSEYLQDDGGLPPINPILTATAPMQNAIAAVDSTINAIFNKAVTGADATNFVIHRSFKGKQNSSTGTYSGSNNSTLSFNPMSDFLAGEKVAVTLTAGIKDDANVAITPVVYQFRTAVIDTGTGASFSNSEQDFENISSTAIDMADLDGDGDIDAFVGNNTHLNNGNKVLLNDGTGRLSDSGQSLGNEASLGLALGDLDGDGDSDAFVANFSGLIKVWLNDGAGNFSDTGQFFGGIKHRSDVSLGDFDADGDLDAFVSNRGGANKVWLNNGTGFFTDLGQSLGSSSSWGCDLADVDGDGDLDVFVVNTLNEPNKVWLNNGSGVFTDSGQSLGNEAGFEVVLADLDADGDSDAFVSNSSGANKIWLNNGAGIFTDSGQALGSSTSYGLDLGDLDGDGDLDAFVGNQFGQENKIWLNNGTGIFSDSGQSLGNKRVWGVKLADLNNDGDLDVFLTGTDGDHDNTNLKDEVWFNDVFVQSTGPVANEIAAPLNSTITTTFNENVVGANANNFVIHRGFKGIQSDSTGGYTGNNTSTLSFDPTANFLAGEDIQVTLTTGITSIPGNSPILPYVFEFSTETPTITTATFTDSGQSLGDGISFNVKLGDLDADGDLDAFVANSNFLINNVSRVWLNNGVGAFTDSGQSLISTSVRNVDLADLDADGDLDAFIAIMGSNKVLLNNGSGIFSDSGQSLGNSQSFDVDLADLDADGDLDAFVTNTLTIGSGSGGNTVWLNDGTGVFSDSGQSLGDSFGLGVDIADLDGDGDIDVFEAIFNKGNKIWLNNGSGVFTDSGQSLGNNSLSNNISLADLDGDGDQDAFVVNIQANEIWLNDGVGNFTDSSQILGTALSYGVDLADFDGDGDLDAFVANSRTEVKDGSHKIWLNNGSGIFIDSGQSLGTAFSRNLDVADLDGDGDLDAFIANGNNEANKVWLNGN